jgi:hypothetical protein
MIRAALLVLVGVVALGTASASAEPRLRLIGAFEPAP